MHTDKSCLTTTQTLKTLFPYSNQMISVVMLVYKRSEYTDKTLACIAENSKWQYELVVCMDWEDRETYKKLKSYYNSFLWYMKVVCPHKKLGVNALRNIGIENASNDTVLVINDDVLLSKWFDEALEKEMETQWFVCPQYTEGKNERAGVPTKKWNNISGHARAVRKSKWTMVWPIPSEKLNIRFGDDWIFRKIVDLKQGVYRTDKLLSHHFISKTLDAVDMSEQIDKDREAWKWICKEHRRFDPRTATDFIR